MTHTPQEPRTRAGKALTRYAENVQQAVHPVRRQPTQPHVCNEPEACDLILEMKQHVLAIEAEAAAHTHSPCQKCGVMEAVLCEEQPGIDVDTLLAAERVVQGWDEKISEGGMAALISDLQNAMTARVARLTSSENGCACEDPKYPDAYCPLHGA